jgi:hypothetical protein
VAQALIDEGRRVQPHYLLDPNRRSLRYELRAMTRLREALAQRVAEGQLLPTALTLVPELVVSPRIRECFEKLESSFHMGTQNVWLAAYAERERHVELEYCLENFGAAFPSELVSLLREHIDETGHEARVDIRDDARLALFERFRFPIIHLYKDDAAKIAESGGYRRLLDHTWFCHEPVGGQPCGHCRPCRIAKANDRSADYAPRFSPKRAIRAFRGHPVW